LSQPILTPHLDNAASRDAAGDHDEAINELARGTRAGDLRCTRELGLRMLMGDRAPLLPAEGLRFIDDVCRTGQGEPAARVAAVLALGVNLQPNRNLALQWLCRSAQLGWESAQRQLLALCDDRALAGRASAARAEGKAPDWKVIADAVDLSSWQRPAPPVIRSQEPRVSVFPGFLRPEICEYIISLAPGRLEPARVYDPVAREDIVVAHRNNTVANFDERSIELVQVLLQSRMSASCGIPAAHMEGPTVLHYDPGEQIADHYDFVDPKTTPDYAGEIARNGQRIITFIVYLNNEYEGGETSFPRLGFSHRGSLGEGIYFVNALADLTPDQRMIHAGRPIERGEKWIVTQFVRSRPTRGA